MFRIFVKY